MFIKENEKEGKIKALEDLLGQLDSIDSKKLGKKPMVAEMSVTKIEPKNKLLSEMKSAGHEGVEEAEETLFPEEEKKEEMMEGESESESESEGGISEEDKAMIEELYNRYCR